MTSSADRDHKRQKGMKLGWLQFPNTSMPELKAEARRQSLIVSSSPHAKDDQAFINSITLKWWEDEG